MGTCRYKDPKKQRNLCIFMDSCTEVWLGDKKLWSNGNILGET